MLLGGCLEPELVALASSLRKKVAAPALRVIERAVLRGDLRPDVDPGLVLDTISGWILHTIFRQRAVVTDERLEALVDLLLAGAAVRRNGGRAGSRGRPLLRPSRSRATPRRHRGSSRGRRRGAAAARPPRSRRCRRAPSTRR